MSGVINSNRTAPQSTTKGPYGIDVSSAAALNFEPPHVLRARRDREREGDPQPEVVERPLSNQAITEVELLAACEGHVCDGNLVRFVDRHRVPLLGYLPNALNALCIDVNRDVGGRDRKSTRLNSSHGYISYAVFCLK